MIRALPAALRARAALAHGARARPRDLSRARARSSKLKRGTASIDLRGSLFCEVREASVAPLCGFYAAAIARVLQLFDAAAPTRASASAAPSGGRTRLRACRSLSVGGARATTSAAA